MTEWLCEFCGHLLGRIEREMLVEAKGNKSALPCIRRCPNCHKRNILTR